MTRRPRLPDDDVFEPRIEITHILVVSDVERSSRFWVDVLGAAPYREYGGTSAVLRLPARGCCS